jgi:hypothetical protein
VGHQNQEGNRAIYLVAGITQFSEIMFLNGLTQDRQDVPMAEEPDDMPSKEEIMDFLSDFMKEGRHAEQVFRDNYCELVVNKVFNDFGYEGLCALMIKIDHCANWISDILIENSDFDEIMFKKYGVYDSDICAKARETKAMMEMNSKIWRLRKKYAKTIVDELMGTTNEQ